MPMSIAACAAMPLGVWLPDTPWQLVKSGELNGFSLDGIGVRVPKTLTLDIPEELAGETELAAGHVHSFVVKFDEDGGFLGGSTDRVDGHWHDIVRGTAISGIEQSLQDRKTR